MQLISVIVSIVRCSVKHGPSNLAAMLAQRWLIAACNLQVVLGACNTLEMTELAVCMLLMYTCRGLQCYEGRYDCLSYMSCMLRHL